jgi:hypothetical protein
MSIYVDWAKKVIKNYVEHNIIIDDEEFKNKKELKKSAGCFVSIHTKDGDLRGCIGTITPFEESLYEEIRNNAISASTRDPRFYPIRERELESLEINVDILGDIEVVEDLLSLDSKIYGVIVEKNGRKGLLLPNLPGVDTVEQQIEIAKQKAGLGKCSVESLKISRFKVERHY